RGARRTRLVWHWLQYVCRRSASFISFILPYFVMAGLDPAIHAAARLIERVRYTSIAARQHGPPGQARW
ncbi:MAG TPA: hypothetical protein VEK75_13000, partial [Xanthobacteraceae bacterium]|nr:hypothetical protein [Xanthobacteraceae bacterium]